MKQWLLLLVFVTMSLTITSQLQAQTQLDSCEAMTVRVVVNENGDWSTGSGVVVGGGEYVITAEHVVRSGDVFVYTKERREINCSVVWLSESRDLALLRLSEKMEVPQVHVTLRSNVRKAQTVYVFGFPGKADRSWESIHEVKITKGIVSAINKDENGRGLYQIDAAINPGNSGGPVFNEAGCLVGIAIEKAMAEVFIPDHQKQRVDIEKVPVAEGVGWAVQIDEIIPELESRGIKVAYKTQAAESENQSLEALWSQHPSLFLIIGVLFGLVIAALILAATKRGRERMHLTRSPRPNTDAPVAATKPVLRATSGDKTGDVFPLDRGALVLGRDPIQCNVIISSSLASKKHCTVLYTAENQNFMLVDHNSTNGTYLRDGGRMTGGSSAYLRAGDGFSIAQGGHSFVVGLEDVAP